MESIQADAADPIDEEDHVPPGGIPARNVKGERLLLFLGIIDILQSYRLKKKLEHTLKSMVTDGDTISVHRPNFYAQRFQKFMAERVFKRIPSRGSGRGSDSSAHGDNLGTTSPPTATTPHRSSLHHVRSSHHHVTTVAIQEDRTDVVSVSDVRLETRTDSRSTLSVDSSMASSGHGGHRTHTWTPPLSVEGSTPTWTEGTPSFTESSSSGDLGCPNTPNRSLNTTVDSAQHETEMKQLHHFGSRQHFINKQDRRVMTTFVESRSSPVQSAPRFTTSTSCHYTTIAAIPYNTKTTTQYNYVRSSCALPSSSNTSAREAGSVPGSGISATSAQVNGVVSAGGGVVTTTSPSLLPAESPGVTNGARVPAGTYTVTVQVGDPLKSAIIPATVGVDEI